LEHEIDPTDMLLLVERMCDFSGVALVGEEFGPFTRGDMVVAVSVSCGDLPSLDLPTIAGITDFVKGSVDIAAEVGIVVQVLRVPNNEYGTLSILNVI
jgi:hypothetical protein